QHGIVHRDLKPANILLVSGGVVSREWSSLPLTTHHSPLTPKISDFGLAKDMTGATGAGAPHTGTGTILGSPSYTAPEQAPAQVALTGPATDGSSWVAIFYELMPGRPPFRAETGFDTVLQVVHEEPVPPRRLQPKLPLDLETICQTCLRKEPPRRYASALA